MDKKFKQNPNTPEKLEQLYSSRKLSPETERVNEWMMPYLLPLVPATGDVLEVGCGLGKTLSIISESSSVRLKGIDISPTAIEKAEKYYQAIYFECMNFENSIEKLKYDLVICSQTLEHVDNPELMINKLKESVKINGTLFITVPWPKSSLDNGVKNHYWRFYPEDFYELISNDCLIEKEGTRMVVIWVK